mmetsp:Transcript_12198/g.19443  ORF Transcript_12198/g.19443 Transcript_12198/m.19443 type:complete len:86 (-) Transcript_12198:1500-1757(-)
MTYVSQTSSMCAELGSLPLQRTRRVRSGNTPPSVFVGITPVIGYYLYQKMLHVSLSCDRATTRVNNFFLSFLFRVLVSIQVGKLS